MKMAIKNPRRIKEVKIVVSVLAMKEYREGRCIVPLHSFLTSALEGCQLSSLDPGSFTPGKEPTSHWKGDWMDLWAFLDI
jgi:hypothetical protein